MPTSSNAGRKADSSKFAAELRPGDFVRVVEGSYSGMTGVVEVVYGTLAGIRLTSTGQTKQIELPHVQIERLALDDPSLDARL